MRYRPVMIVVTATLLLATACGGNEQVQGRADPAAEAPAATPSATSTETTTPTATDEPDAGSSEQSTNQPPLMLVMDLSDSMTRPDPGGGTLLDGAEQALEDVVAELPDGAPTGLTVYGRQYPNTDKANGCTDVEVIQPVQPLDRTSLLADIGELSAKGWTPIGKALQDAAEALPAEGERTIVLVSDGEDTCAPPAPCDVARELRADGVDLVVNTVGFALGDNDKARSELSCIADTAGGTFVDAADAAELSDVLPRVAVRDSREAELSGSAMEGGPLPRDAETGKPGTRYTDTVLGGETNYYRFEVPEKSSVGAEVIATARPGEGCSGRIWARTVDSGDSRYEFDNDHFPKPGGAPVILDLDNDTIEDEDEVYLKVDTERCELATQEFDIEFEVTVD